MKSLISIFALVSSMFLMACGDDTPGSGSWRKDPTTKTMTYRCNASIQPSTFSYELVEDNTRVKVTDPVSGKEDTWERRSFGDHQRPILGSWKIYEESQSMAELSFKLVATMTVEENRVSITSTCSFSDGVEMTARASSSAEVTDDTIVIHESDVDEQVLQN